MARRDGSRGSSEVAWDSDCGEVDGRRRYPGNRPGAGAAREGTTTPALVWYSPDARAARADRSGLDRNERAPGRPLGGGEKSPRPGTRSTSLLSPSLSPPLPENQQARPTLRAAAELSHLVPSITRARRARCGRCSRKSGDFLPNFLPNWGDLTCSERASNGLKRCPRPQQTSLQRPVNRRVVGSSPTRGATGGMARWKRLEPVCRPCQKCPEDSCGAVPVLRRILACEGNSLRRERTPAVVRLREHVRTLQPARNQHPKQPAVYG